jgi:hypothetical protein
MSFGLIQYRVFVPEWVANARTPAYRQVERRLDSLAARPQECCKRFVDVGDDNVRLGPNAEVDNQFRIRLWKLKANRLLRSPQQAVTQLVPVKRDRRLKVGDAKQMTVNLPK